MQIHEALITILTPAGPLGQILPILTIIVAGAYNLRAAHNLARAVRGTVRDNPDD
jgi:type IV secretory pathway VirB2 component (pilin)